MKKLFCFLLSFFLLFSTSGFVLRAHYCGGRLASVSSGYLKPARVKGSNELCCVVKNNEGKPCCSDKQIKIHAKKDPLNKHSVNKFMALAYISSQPLVVTIADAAFFQMPVYFVKASTGPPLYKLFQQLLFYA